MRSAARAFGALLRLLHAYSLVQIVASSEYGVPIEIQLWDTGRSPLAHMVDVTNQFGLKVLAEHNFLNDNNIAFSPYGLTGIMVALYEGIDGESSFQIQRGMQMPWNRKVVRIGFRDIHRTLKTYFVPEEGFLAGLALNNENVTFNESYKKTLRFYGFDLDKDQLPTLQPTNNSTTITPPKEAATEIPPLTTAATVPRTPESDPSGKDETTANIDVRGPPTTSSSVVTDSDMSTLPQTTTDQSTNTERDDTETTISSTETPPTSTSVLSTKASTPVSETPLESTTATLLEEPTLNNDVETIPTALSDTTSNTGAISVSESTVIPNTQETSTMTTIGDQLITTINNDVTSTEQTVLNETSLETLDRKKKSVVDFIFTSPPYVDDYLIYKSYDIPPPLTQPSSSEGEKMFLVNGLKNVEVTYMHYDTILEHAYLPHLEASALRLPLDSERYYLLVVLPSRAGVAELGRLIARMARESDLRDVHGALQPRRVRAIVPSFTVKGHVTLTTDLQKLGIRDVFEPRQRDFTPMTAQGGVYVRSVEQAVSVAIRKYRPDDQKRNRYVTNRLPVHFSATYPFIYFVMDATIHVSLMAGKMVDPLNTRIL